MNILVIAHNQDDESPYVTFVHDQVLALKKLGHNVVVIAPTTFGKGYKNLTKKVKYRIVDGIPIYYPRNISISRFGLYHINPLLGYFAVRKCLRQIEKNFKIDIIHAHTISFDGKIAVKLKKELKVPVVITTHGSDTIVPVLNGKKKNLIEVCKQADKVIAVSSVLANYLKNNLFQVDVILNGFNKKWINKEEKVPFSVIQVSSLIKQKKVDITIRAFQKVLEQYPQAKLIVVGNGEEKLALKKLCCKLNIEKSIFFIGKISNKDVLRKMSESEIFVMPSVREGLGIVYLEAMGAGCITFGTKNEGIEDVILDGENGFLIAKDDFKSLADMILNVFHNPEKYKDLRKKGKESVEKLTWETNANQYITLYKKLIALQNKGEK